jgi:hypothetical protein
MTQDKNVFHLHALNLPTMVVTLHNLVRRQMASKVVVLSNQLIDCEAMQLHHNKYHHKQISPVIPGGTPFFHIPNGLIPNLIHGFY